MKLDGPSLIVGLDPVGSAFVVTRVLKFLSNERCSVVDAVRRLIQVLKIRTEVSRGGLCMRG